MYKLQPSMMTGVAQIDAEHLDLVTAINQIGAAGQEKASPDVIRRLGAFRDDVVRHFENEERYLRIVRYPAADSHAKHHAEIIAALDRLVEGLQDGALTPRQVAEECFHELIGAVIVMDMRFRDWHAEATREAGQIG